LSREESDARAIKPQAPQCDHCRNPMAFVVTVFQAQVFECAKCKKAILIPESQRGG
jgi:hypothetical protein